MDAQIVQRAVDGFHESQEQLDERLQDALATLDADFKRLDDVVRLHKSQMTEFLRIKAMLQELEGAEAERIAERLDGIKSRLDRLRASKPRTGSMFVRFILGHVNAKVWKRSEILNLKIQYNKFKERTTYLFILLPLMTLFFSQSRFVAR